MRKREGFLAAGALAAALVTGDPADAQRADKEGPRPPASSQQEKDKRGVYAHPELLKAARIEQNLMPLRSDFLNVARSLDVAKNPYKNRDLKEIRLSDYLPRLKRGLTTLDDQALTPSGDEKWTTEQKDVVTKEFRGWIVDEINRFRRVNLKGWEPVKAIVD